MPRGGARPGAGRPRSEPTGEQSTRPAERQKARDNAALVTEAMVLELTFWRNRAVAELQKPAADQVLATIKEALSNASEAATKLAPYVLRRLASVQHTEVPYDLSRLSDAELEQWELLARRAAIVDDAANGASKTQH